MKLLSFLILFAVIMTASPIRSFADASASPTILKAPPSPKFSDTERQAELAKRRAAVASAMADNSMMILFSAEPRLYTNDVDYVYRQENNLFYLTGLKQDGATLVITNNVGNVAQTLFLPMRIPLREA